MGGFQVGANKQFGTLVVGLEADVSWTGLSADGRFTTPLGSQWDIKSDLDMLGTVRGRLGVAAGPMLWYVTGGLAVGQVDTKQATNFVDNNGKQIDVGGRTSGTNYHVGWTIGGGGEYMLGAGWTLKAEYLYVDLGNVDYALRGSNKPSGTPGATPYTETFSSDMNFHIGRLGLNYRF